MRRLFALAAVAAIGVVAMPAGADPGPLQPEVRDEAVTDPDETATRGFDEEVEVTDDEVGLIGLKWDGDSQPGFRVTVQNENGEWEAIDAEPPDSEPDPDSDEARQAASRRGAAHVSEPVAVEDPAKVRVEVDGGTATDVELITVTTPGGDELPGETDEAGILPRTIAVISIAGVAIALALPGNRRRLGPVATLTVLAVGLGVVATASAPPAQGAIPAAPQIISRAGWGADESLRNCGPEYARPRMGIIHHTVNPNGYSAAAAPGIVRGIYAFHTQGQGWCDIGYNFLVDRYGRVYEGRYGGIGRGVIGAHAAPFNTGSFGVAIIGDFTGAGPTGSSVAALINLFQWKMSVHNINPYGGVFINGGWYDTIVGHRDVNQTSCPGQHLYTQLTGIRNAVKPAVVFGSPFGMIEKTRREGTYLRAIGWAMDPDTPNPIQIDVYVGGPYGAGGKGAFFGKANVPRSDVGAFFANGNNHGFNLKLRAWGPRNQVCVYAHGVANGAGVVSLGCRTFTVDPRGNFEAASRNGNRIRVVGWGLDYDTTQPIRVRVFQNGVRLATGLANRPRPDVAAVYPGLGVNKGFDFTVTGKPGVVCVRLVNEARGSDVWVRCRAV